MMKVNILLVDDRSRNFLALQAELDSPCQNIVTASSRVEVLDRLASAEFALVLIQVEMESMGGIELASIIKGREGLKDVPIIFLASDPNPQLVYHGYAAGAVDYLVMPFDPSLLRAKINVFVELHRKYSMQREQLLAENLRLHEISQKAVELRNDFLSVASHELNTPVTSLKLQLQMVLKTLRMNHDGSFSIDRFTRSIDSSVKQVDRLIKLIQVLLDASSFQSGKFSLVFEEFKAQELIEDVIERNKELLINSNCDLKIENEFDGLVVWDKKRIEQILTNLLHNAIKYAPGKIELTLKDDAQEIILSLRDFGKGIPRSFLNSLFNEFEKRPSQAYVSGLGLGLYIVKQIVEGHQGKVKVHSNEGGTVFNVHLPKIVNEKMVDCTFYQ